VAVMRTEATSTWGAVLGTPIACNGIPGEGAWVRSGFLGT